MHHTNTTNTDKIHIHRISLKATYLCLLLHLVGRTSRLLCCLQNGLCMLMHALLSVVFSPCSTVVWLSSLRVNC